jgi:ABC-type transport system involved in multi-copper enzyme maturation permease subunit
MNQEIKSVNNPSMVKAIMRKDWYFNKHTLLLFFISGLISVALLSFESRAFYIGMVLLLSIVILTGALLVINTVVNERKNQTLAFLISLPITYMDFTKAKMIFNLLAYIVIWIILALGTIGVLYYTEHLPSGLIPYALIILIELLVAFILILGTALVTESEKWTIVVMSITNIGVSLFMFLIASMESINQHMNGPIAVWNSTALTVISIEIFVALIIISLTFYLQSRKKDFT